MHARWTFHRFNNGGNRESYGFKTAANRRKIAVFNEKIAKSWSSILPPLSASLPKGVVTDVVSSPLLLQYRKTMLIVFCSAPLTKDEHV